MGQQTTGNRQQATDNGQQVIDEASQTSNLNPQSLKHRPRRLRKNEVVRKLVRETILHPSQFIAPIFIHEGTEAQIPISSMPGVCQYSTDGALRYIEELQNEEVRSFIIFGVPGSKDAKATSAWDENGIIQKANRKIKERFPDVVLINDTCLCEYMDHGHCGVVQGSKFKIQSSEFKVQGSGFKAQGSDIDNDSTLEILQKTAVSQAASGADIIAPSGMMDGMVGAIRDALDRSRLKDISIMSYAVKYASSFYGPFREAAESTPQFGDRKTYQMDPANKREAIKEALLDEKEGADFIMVKPALSYLDIISAVKEQVNLPVVTYNVSGEYSMIKAAAGNGWIDEDKAVLEMLTSMKRAGADVIISYFAKDVLRLIKD